MRIVAHNGARIWGGAERATVLLLRGLRDRGHEVLLLCNDELVRANAVDKGLPAEVCAIGGDVALHHAWRFGHALKRFAPQALIIGTYKKLFLASLGARIARVPRVVARVGLETDTPRSVKYRVALRRWVDGVAVNAERMIAPFASLEGFGPQKVALIHNGVAAPPGVQPDRSLRDRLGIPEDGFVVGTVARLAAQKRLDRLIEAVALADARVHCIIAGDGEERDSLSDILARSGAANRVHLIGHLQNPDPALGAMDAFMVTSDREGMSNSMLEAMAHGLPVITTPVSGAADAVEGSQRAGIVTTFDPGDIARAIESLRADPALRDAMGREARHKATTTFSLETMLDRWEAFLAA